MSHSKESTPLGAFQPEAEHHWRFLCLLAHCGRRRINRLWQRRPPSLQDRESQDGLHPEQALTGEAGLAWLQRKLPTPAQSWQALQDRVLGSDIGVLLPAQLPMHMTAIPDPPLALYVQGAASLLDQAGVAVVGARRCSATGAVFAQRLAERLAASGLVVISGLALGIDAAAHRGAVSEGRTVAVLGSGLHNLHPKSHAGLAEKIIKTGGTIVSEYSPTYPSYPGNFPERNRLISGFASAVVVVEAGLRSGSLITARLALEQGREVLAVPGSVVNPVSAGCHRLLKQGASLVTDVQDVFAALGINPKVQVAGFSPLPSASKKDPKAIAATDGALSAEGQVFAQLHGEPMSVEALSKTTGFAVPQLLTLLTRLELAGFVQRLPQGYIPTPR